MLLIILLIIPPNPWLYLIVNALISISALFYSTAAKIVLPDIIEDKEALSRATSLISFVLKVARILGASTAAVFLLYFNAKILFIFDCLSFILNSIIVINITFASHTETHIDSDDSLSSKVKDAIRYILKNDSLIVNCIYYGLLFLIEGLLYSQIVVFIKKDLQLGDQYYGIFQNCILVGVITSQLILSKFKFNETKGIRHGLFICTISLLSLAFFENIFIALIYGLSQPLIITSWYTDFYKSTPSELRGRVLSICTSIFEIVRLIGIAIVFFTCDIISARNSFILSSSLILFFIFVSSLKFKGSTKSNEINTC